MKIKVLPPQHPDQINLDYMVDVQFGDKRIEQFELIASYRPDPNNPLNAIRVGIAGNLMGQLPLGTDQAKLTEMVEGVGTVFTPESLQFWPQYAEQPDTVRRMPQYAKILEKVKLDACKALMSFMKDKTSFHVFTDNEPVNDGSIELSTLPVISYASDHFYVVKLTWGQPLSEKERPLLVELVPQFMGNEVMLDITRVDLIELCTLADLIPYWQKNIVKNN